MWLPRTVALLLRNYKEKQEQLKEFLGSTYMDHDLVFALDNGNPVIHNYIRTKFQQVIEQHDFPVVVIHSLRHLSTRYKLKMTNGDVKSVQRDTGHAEVEMVMDVYARVIDEDRRLYAQKLDLQFYEKLEESKVASQTQTENDDAFF